MMCVIQDDLGDGLLCGRVATSVLVPDKPNDPQQKPWPA